jgi:hypothetical protein
MTNGDARQHDQPAECPADVLGDVWDALDLLPTSTMPASMTATTIEMAAVSARARIATSARRSLASWLLAAVAVAGCFAIGLVVGRITLPWPEPRLPPRVPPREAIREIIEQEIAKQRRQQWERMREQRRTPRPPGETPAPQR